jgi:beta-glucosidase/6-phospho-beta-glucosidase/beta-galactosidase
MLTLLFTILISQSWAQVRFPSTFIFGVANAPAQVEDKLTDPWSDWGKSGFIRSWKIVPNPDLRLEFWTHPETELDLAQKLGVQSFRMGIDWGRVMPSSDVFDEGAIKRYREIILMAKKRNLKVMMTLMHHSVPKWVMDQGGWHNQKTKLDFITFSQRMLKEFQSEIEFWITFNEANVFITNAYTIGIWPPGEKHSPLSLVAFGPFRGSSIKALDLMADAHNEIYDWSHQEFPKIKMGLAHNMAHYTTRGFFDRVSVYFANEVMNWRFPERTRGKMDFFGFNYYGAEWLKGEGIDLDPSEEYSEAGRAIDVNGLYDLLKEIHSRFSDLPIMITENGVADSEDTIRGSYLIEHLLAVKKAIDDHIPVVGYYVWTLTDNLEWSDGYCPKFGLVGVNRKSFERLPRPSFETFKKIILENEITSMLRDSEWKKVTDSQGKNRPFCRGDDGVTAFDSPMMRKYSRKDWRFNRTKQK